MRKVLTSESFIEKSMLLLLTALLSGLIIPYILRNLDSSRNRNDAILQSQSKLLDDISITIFTYETLVLDVSWYMTPNGENLELHQKAFSRYNQRAIDLIAKLRSLINKVEILASPEIAQDLDKFLSDVFDKQDTPMLTLYRGNASVDKWYEFHKSNVGMLARARTLILELANDLGISKSSYQP